jgi:plastocyanin
MTRHALVRSLAALLIASWFVALTSLQADAASQSVTMAGYAFQPVQVSVRVGDSVTWTNQDQAPHDATATSAPVMFHSPTLSTGQSWTYTFTQPGTYSYICSIHPSMRAQIVVLPAQTASAAPAPAAPKSVQASPPTTHHTTMPTTAAPSSTESSAAAAPPPSGTPTTPEPTQQAMTPTAQTTLDPMLLVVGLVAAVSVLCLLLIGSRPPTDPATSDGNDRPQ